MEDLAGEEATAPPSSDPGRCAGGADPVASADVTDSTTEHGTRIEIRLAPAADQNAVLALLHGFWAIRHTIEVALGEPLQSVIATITDDAHHDLAARLLALTTAAWPSP